MDTNRTYKCSAEYLCSVAECKDFSYLIPVRKFYHDSTVLCYTSVNVQVKKSHYRPEVSRGFQEVKVPRLCDNGPEWW